MDGGGATLPGGLAPSIDKSHHQNARSSTMTIQITHVKFSGLQKTHEAIVEYKWKNRENGSVGSSIKSVLVKWIDDNGLAYVGTGAQQVKVMTVHPAGIPAYLRTSKDGIPTNNLLSLPTF
jgi:hypothetical protein